ncbi:MAG: hypothetical protein HQM08_29385 [Candidatus Riflebacteria bacterium]|nr:hypothetical protein [Candidatus Riflebacteria bacterium]
MQGFEIPSHHQNVRQISGKGKIIFAKQTTYTLSLTNLTPDIVFFDFRSGELCHQKNKIVIRPGSIPWRLLLILWSIFPEILMVGQLFPLVRQFPYDQTSGLAVVKTSLTSLNRLLRQVHPQFSVKLVKKGSIKERLQLNLPFTLLIQ